LPAIGNFSPLILKYGRLPIRYDANKKPIFKLFILAAILYLLIGYLVKRHLMSKKMAFNLLLWPIAVIKYFLTKK